MCNWGASTFGTGLKYVAILRNVIDQSLNWVGREAEGQSNELLYSLLMSTVFCTLVSVKLLLEPLISTPYSLYWCRNITLKYNGALKDLNLVNGVHPRSLSLSSPCPHCLYSSHLALSKLRLTWGVRHVIVQGIRFWLGITLQSTQSTFWSFKSFTPGCLRIHRNDTT
jgi:hypothetical protein